MYKLKASTNIKFMKKDLLDLLKEKISFDKLLLTFLVTMDTGTVAWVFNNIGKAEYNKIITAFFAIIFLSVFAIALSLKIKNFIKDLIEIYLDYIEEKK